MIRTAVTVFLLMVAVLTVPLWVQLILFCIALVTIPYRLTLFIPALFADLLYAPERTVLIANMRMTILVALLLVIYFLILTQTRITQVYDLETK